jgi:ketosteroid isomerase-like protein
LADHSFSAVKGGAMKNVLAVAVLCVVTLPLAAGQSATKVEDEIKKLEQDWAQAVSTALDQYEADDILMTAPGGRVMDKAQHKTDLSSGDLKFESMELSDMTVHVYGDTAVVVGTNNLHGTYKGQDISGRYRFTDTWVKRNGKWQVVARASTVGGPDAAR